MTESNSLMVKRERERELKKHQERIQSMKPCINSKRGIVRESFSPETKRPVRVRIDKGETPLLHFSTNADSTFRRKFGRHLMVNG